LRIYACWQKVNKTRPFLDNTGLQGMTRNWTPMTNQYFRAQTCSVIVMFRIWWSLEMNGREALCIVREVKSWLYRTAHDNADNPFAVIVGKSKKPEKTSYVLCHQPKSFDWRSRKASPHPLKRLQDHLFAEVCACLNQIVQLA
jgi:hypothetical protein